jgi:predicted nucleic acid-binding protein
MRSTTALTDPAAILVADSSTVINLVATRMAAAVISALPNRVVVTDAIPAELETGRPAGRKACDGLSELVDAGAIAIVTLDCDAAMLFFEELVVGPAAETLDDGEAATIAYALAHGCTALIDERKAIRLCRERFPNLPVACTLDVFLHGAVQDRLGAAGLGDAVFNALVDARMRIVRDHLSWVLSVIGQERARACESLPQQLRSALQSDMR